MAYQDQEKNRDARIAATSRIWGFATVMLGICIPLSAVTRHGAILPIAGKDSGGEERQLPEWKECWGVMVVI